MRSIALGVEHLRGLERHGGGAMMERAFSGFAALPPPKGLHWDTLGIPPGSQAHDIERAFRRKAMTAHPDHGGSDAAMAELTSAREAALQEIGMA
jgi:DnaJ-class molecular chaperone